ncbi:MAG: T9SS type A sorting domain-containing protein [Bacteroidia bacterium]
MRISAIFLLLLMTLVSVAEGYSQTASEVIGPVEPAFVPWIPARPAVSRSVRDTLRVSPTALFIDDFSEGTVPDSGFWFPGAGRYPLLRRQGADAPPSVGTACFDGISPYQQVYSTIVGRGPADRLETHYLDLSGQDPDNLLFLSFDVQAKGYGHAPISKDSFKVYFNAIQGGREIEVPMFALGGNGLVSGFQTVFIPIQEQRFFHTHFYIAFENEGLLNGMLSNWHLDYVALGLSRTASDSSFNDRALVKLDRPVFAPYSAIPFMQYKPNTYASDANLEWSNLGNQSGNQSFALSITDPVGNNLSPAYTGSLNEPYSGINLYSKAIGQLNDNQSLASPYASTFHQLIAMAGNDAVSSNNTLVYDYRVDSLFAMDDGEADVGYGINRLRGFGQRYELREADTLMAVWIHFVPQIDYIFGGSLEGKTFSLAIWSSPNRDSLIYEEGFQITYGNTADHFERYALQQPISVSGDIWVGIIQNDNTPVGVGMDRTWDNDSLVVWDSSGVWVNSRLAGSLMIRPELRNIRYNPLPPPSSLDDVFGQRDFSIFPQPATGSQFVHWQWSGLDYQEFSLEIVDLSGKKICQLSGKNERSGTLPQLPAGMYVVFQKIRLGGRWHQQTHRLQIAP